jgi:choline dehydrogenase
MLIADVAFGKLPTGLIPNATTVDLDSTFGNDWPDIEMFSLDAYTGTLNDHLLGAPRLDNFTAVCIALVAPSSRGNVSIVSQDTKDHPIVNPNWLTNS